MTASGATKLRKGHQVRNVPFLRVSTERCGALNTLTEQTAFRGQRGGHITSSLQAAWVSKPAGIHRPACLSRAPGKPPALSVLCLFFYSCTRPPQQRPDLLLLSPVTSCAPERTEEPQGVREVFHHWPKVVSPRFDLFEKLQREVFLCLLRL